MRPDEPGTAVTQPQSEPSTPAPGGPAVSPPEQPEHRSGLRDPIRAIRGLGAGTLTVEALVLLLAVQPVRLVGGELTGAALGVVVGLAVAAAVLAGMLRRSWAWPAATGLQALLLLAGFLHWSLGVLGLVFGLVWAYVLHVRRVILG